MSGTAHTFDPIFYLVQPAVASHDVMRRLMDCCQTSVPSFNPPEIDALRRLRFGRLVFAVKLNSVPTWLFSMPLSWWTVRRRYQQ